MNTIDGATTSVVTATAVTTITGAASAVNTALSSSGINGLGEEFVTLTGSTSVADANTISGKTTGAVTATITEGDVSTLKTLNETTNAYTLVITDTTVAVADLETLDGLTTVAVNASNVTTLTGTISAVTDIYAANTAGTISGLGNEAVTISDTTSVAVASLNTLDGKTTGTINASTIQSLTGTAADLNTAYASSGISGLGNEAVTISDTSLWL